MKHDTRGTQKFRKLHRLLGRPYWEVVGILESIWLFTTVNTPLGDIGRFTNQEICDDIEYGADPEILIEALLDCGFLDDHSKCRICVHDWHDHAPRFIRLRAERAGTPIVSIDGQRRTCAHMCAVVGITQPNPTQPNRTKPKVSASAEGAKPPKKKRQPDPIWDTVVALWFPSGATGREKRIGKLVKQFKGVGATETVLRERHAMYLKHWPGIDCTPDALFKHWDQIKDESHVGETGTERTPGRIPTPDGKYDDIEA